MRRKTKEARALLRETIRRWLQPYPTACWDDVEAAALRLAVARLSDAASTLDHDWSAGVEVRG